MSDQIQQQTPPPDPSPLSAPGNDTFGTIMKYALPAIAAVAAGSNPALARGVSAAGDIMNLQQQGALRKQEMQQKQRLADMGLSERQATMKYLQGISSDGAPPANANPVTKVGVDDDLGSGADLGSGGSDTASPRIQQSLKPQPAPPSSVTSPIQKAMLAQAQILAQGGHVEEALKLSQEATRYGMRPTAAQVAEMSKTLPPGVEFDAPTIENYTAKAKGITPHYSPHAAPVMAPPGTVGPNGEDLSGKASAAVYDETSGKMKFLGERPDKQYREDPFDVLYRETMKPEGQRNPEVIALAKRAYDQAHQPNRTTINAGQQQDTQAAMHRVAEGLANGDLTSLKQITSLRGNQRLLIYDEAKQINPKFNPNDVERKLKTLDEFQNGKDAQQLQSFGTFLEHAGNAVDALGHVSQSAVPALNKSLNWWRTNMSGDPAYQQFTTALEPVRKEFEGFLLGGRALYGDDRKQAEVILNDDSSPAGIRAALQQMGGTANDRFNEMNYRFKRSVGKDIENPFSPEALEGAQKIGVRIGAGARAAGPAAAAGGGNEAPVGTIVTVKGQRQVKTAQGWRPAK